MASILQELESFTQFALQRIQAGDPAASIDSLYDQWRDGRPAPEDSNAVLASLRDIEQGITGRDFAAFADEFAKRNGVCDDELPTS